MRPLDLTLQLISPTTKKMPWWSVNWVENEMEYEKKGNIKLMKLNSKHMIITYDNDYNNDESNDNKQN